jgi:hypothetical protein
MAPVPIYTQSPISAAKASGITPQTPAPAVEDGRTVSASSAPVATTTSHEGYPAARPGAVPSLPAPTGAAQSQRYAPVEPTRTSNAPNAGPPPPQPGAIPVARSARPTVPPPPKAGEKYQAPVQTQEPSLPAPPQMAIPAPSVPYSAQRATSTATAPGQPDSDNRLNHPPGYHQNVNASGFGGGDRMAYSADVSRGGRGSGADDDEGVWDTAKRMVQAAGDRLSAAESEVWRRINKE